MGPYSDSMGALDRSLEGITNAPSPGVAARRVPEGMYRTAVAAGAEGLRTVDRALIRPVTNFVRDFATGVPTNPPAASALTAPKTAPAPAPRPSAPPSAMAKATLNDGDLAQKRLGTDTYTGKMTTPQDQRQYGSAIVSAGLGLQGATKAGLAAGPTKAPQPLSDQDQKDRQLYWQQVRAGVDNDITRRALTRAAFNRGSDTMTENGVDSRVRQSAMAQLGGMSGMSQRAAEVAQDTDLKKQALGAASKAADREWEQKQTWFNAPVLEPIPDNATEEMVADAQARNDAIQTRALQAKKNILRWVLEQRAQGVDADPIDYYFDNPDIAAEYAPQSFGQNRGYADGGMVEDPGPDPALVAQYQDYVTRTQEVGATPVPFEAFSQMQDGAMQMFANGGSVAGKMVLDTDPNAPVDSIPATVDDESPARLNSGEFVFPADVVAHFGTDRLNKMIQAARKGAMEGVQ